MAEEELASGVLEPDPAYAYINEKYEEMLYKFMYTVYNIIKEEGKNVYFSPFALHRTLAALYYGSRNLAKRDFERKLDMVNPDQISTVYKDICSNFPPNNNDYFSIMYTTFYIQYQHRFEDSSVRVIKDKFKINTEPIDFSKNVEAADKINKYFLSISHGLYDNNLVKADDFLPRDRLVPVIATVFGDNWGYDVNHQYTTQDNFHISSEESIRCHMMVWRKPMLYTKNKELHAEIIKIPLKTEQFSMLIFIPCSRLAELEEQLQYFNISAFMNTAENYDVTLYLPKFGFETTYDLVEPIKQMGLPNLFNSRADFAHLAFAPGSDRLVVSKILQYSTIRITEDVVTTATITAISDDASKVTLVVKSKGEKNEAVVKCNTPFLFMIVYHYCTAYIPLHMGKLCRPTECSPAQVVRTINGPVFL